MFPKTWESGERNTVRIIIGSMADLGTRCKVLFHYSAMNHCPHKNIDRYI